MRAGIPVVLGPIVPSWLAPPTLSLEDARQVVPRSWVLAIQSCRRSE
jgi:hypothetical protein